MAPQRGNANSIRPQTTDAPAFSASSFERVVDSLKLSPEQYQSSTELREWVLLIYCSRFASFRIWSKQSASTMLACWTICNAAVPSLNSFFQL